MTDVSLLAYNNRVLGNGAFTATTGTWTTNPAISNMAIPQPEPYAQVTPDAGAIAFDWEAQDSAGTVENTTADVLALTNHTLPSGAVVKFMDGATELAEITYSPQFRDASSPIVVAILDEPVTLDTVTVQISSAGSDPVLIGGLWVSPSWRKPFALRDFGLGVSSFSQVGQVASTRWANARQSAEELTATYPALTEQEALGPTVQNWRNICRTLGIHSPVIAVPYIRRPYDAYYGLVTRYQQARPHKKGLWTGGFSMQEMAS